MKRFVPLFIAALCVFPTVAQARWVSVPGQWQMSNVGKPTDPTGIYVRDTVYNVLAAGQVDTVSQFSISDALPIPRGLTSGTGVNAQQGGSGSDTTTAFFVVFQCDSSAAPTTPTLSALTVFIDGRVGGFGPSTTLASGWVKCDSTAAVPIAGSQSFAVPIRSIGPYTTASVFAFETLRARVSSTTGIMSGAVRVFIRKWVPD